MENLRWDIGDWDGDIFTPQYSVGRVFWLQDPESHDPSADSIPDGLYPFYSIYGLVGKVRIKDGMVDTEYLDKQIPKRFKRTNDHTFVELMKMNHYGTIELWLGS